jgi:2-polyprenyl-3-methyl-5-hydroxy-6-metoxy-1,4-benzoquinol methylase
MQQPWARESGVDVGTRAVKYSGAGREHGVQSSKDERATRVDYAERYRSRAVIEIFDEIEREVIGEAWGANGFTTVSQAEELRRRLVLSSDSRLLDIGSGCGWPGLYLARATGGEVVVSDMPTEGLELASRRAQVEGLRSLGAVAASARYLPFAEHSFGAIVHVDVLC